MEIIMFYGEMFGYHFDDEAMLIAAVLAFIWLHFLWETGKTVDYHLNPIGSS